jgi:hypothetical protein
MTREILQMALADERRRVAGGTQRIHERIGPQRQRHAIAAHAVHRGHAPSHQRRTVRHANWRRHIKMLEPRAACGDGVDVRRLQHRMAVATQIIHPVLVGDKEKKIRPRHPSLHIIVTRYEYWPR